MERSLQILVLYQMPFACPWNPLTVQSRERLQHGYQEPTCLQSTNHLENNYKLQSPARSWGDIQAQ